MHKVMHRVLQTSCLRQTSAQVSTRYAHLSARPLASTTIIPSQNRTESTKARTTSATTFDPLDPQILTDEVGLPLHPTVLPAEILSPPPTRITSPELQRLHKMAAIAPPVPGSREEEDMLRDLEGLLGLMDQVKKVEFDIDAGVNEKGFETGDMDEERKMLRKNAIRSLLVAGNYADPSEILDGSRIDEELPEQNDGQGHETVRGKDLLEWRTTPMKR